MVEEPDSEAGIDRRLAGVRRGTGDIVKVESREKTGLVGESVVEADGELIADRRHLGRGSEGASAVRP